MTRSRSDDKGRVPAFAAEYYAQRADAALVISEATNISEQAVGYALTPGIGAPLAEAPQEYWYGGDEPGYSDWPAIQTAA